MVQSVNTLDTNPMKYKNKLILSIMALAAMLVGTPVWAHGDVNLEEAKTIVDSNTSCDELSEEKLELIGEYYMSLMHPDESAHAAMDEMMGGEGSDMLHNVHVRIAKKMYCDDGADEILSLFDVRMDEPVSRPQQGNIMPQANTNYMMGAPLSFWHGGWIQGIFIAVIILGILAISKAILRK